KDSDAAVNAIVDELLASEHYGERSAQLWLDVVRYADSDGYRQDAYRPDAWRYRTWVIDSFNQDKPYDQFVREQLAGDEIDPGDPDVFTGTGFLRLGVYEYNQRNARMHWDLILSEMTNVTSEAFLGLGMGCAQCHDHKFDPILQKDYYAMQSFLATVSWPTDVAHASAERREEYHRAEREWLKKTAQIREEMDAIHEVAIRGTRSYAIGQFPEDIQAMYHKSAEDQTPYEAQMAALVQRQVDYQIGRQDIVKKLGDRSELVDRWKELNQELATYQKLKPAPLPSAFVAGDISTSPHDSLLQTREGETAVTPAFLSLLGHGDPEITATDQTTGRRRALADWIVAPENPFTARVIVNRIWQQHFGTGLVDTPNDFGNLGTPPSHPELLDWLAGRLIDNEWSLKSIHRLIATSSTYRQTSRRDPPSLARTVDPSNRLLWRFPPRRLSAEEIRDAMLVSSGELTHEVGRAPASSESTHRALYLKRMRNTPDRLLSAFDAPQGFNSMPTRTTTTTPTQSLLLINGDWTLKRAEAFAERLTQPARKVEEAIQAAYRLTWSREATADEVDIAKAFLESQRQLIESELGPESSTNRDDTASESRLKELDRGQETVAALLTTGNAALKIERGSEWQELAVQESSIENASFTIEGIVQLDSLYDSGTVNTLFARWKDDSMKSPGWAFGVTSLKSRYQPRNLIVQLVGRDRDNSIQYEVVASNLRVPLNRPVYLAAAIRTTPTSDGAIGGEITFYLKDLSEKNAELQTATIPHSIASLGDLSQIEPTLGGRRTGRHFWDGSVARLRWSPGLLPKTKLIPFAASGSHPSSIDLQFSTRSESLLPEQLAWLGAPEPDHEKGSPSPQAAAWVDFCHALLNSNEFLYLH
ncbi:MAG: DUF1549 and DUF1553 domain-containing protein, partial [Verrucomicrobiota bacterium]